MVEGQPYEEKHNFECPRYDSKLHVMMKFQSWSLGNVEYSFITITPRSTLNYI